MSFRARSELEESVLESFVEKIDSSDQISTDVEEVITDSLRRTTLSQQAEAEEIAERLIRGESDETG